MREQFLVSAAVEVFLPAQCALCADPLPARSRGLCPACWSRVLPDPAPRCPRCGNPWTEDDGTPCPACSEAPPPQQSTVVWGEYGEALRRALLLAKHGGHDELVRPLGRRLAGLVAAQPWAGEIEVVTAMPSHPLHRLRRGWIVAEALAREVARVLGRPRIRGLSRKGTARQAGRSRAARRRLPGRAFRASHKVAGRAVLLIDDVMTTGTSLRRAAAAILTAGGRTVHCAVLAAAPEPRRLA